MDQKPPAQGELKICTCCRGLKPLSAFERGKVRLARKCDLCRAVDKALGR
jgi:hypothetical protein